MEAEIHILHESDFYEIKDFRCSCTKCSISKLEHLKQFSICFVRSGFYEQRIFKREHELHIGRLVVSKPEIDYVVRHIDDQPDLVTSFNFTNDFYERVKDHYKDEARWFFSNPDLQSLLVTAHADIEFVHQRLLAQVKQPSALELDDLVLQLVEKVMFTLGNKPQIEVLPEGLKRHHLSTIEKARDFLFQNFSQNISLQQLADYCCVSLFHFSRIFKNVMSVSPHQYLSELRLNQAQLLLQSTQLSVTEVGFQSGFNSLEHFTTMFRQRFKCNPTELRKGKVATMS
jgi:AraC family transcriptional regulator